ncbi:putative pathway-specific nitrogen regulator protein [Botrytis fragariae]|uniref:Putative pathway-specific nitrogen regulator protein n=1 Tax=Botrytis fragariae TaxID=1964551 RepID=A0A8H6B4R2_9HELO|nr:putative pathway-specific nitrogen regulator protein [Botrytis fragariae]KAF5879065.1 putative pathway-specific nitrogen regulator protein [Botrytis fragariae]
MPQSSSHRQSEFEIHEDSNSLNDMVEDKDIEAFDGENATSEGKDIGDVVSQLEDTQRNTEESLEMEESEIGGDSILDQELPELQEDDSILAGTETKHNEHDDCEDCKHAREEKRKRAEARELQMRRIDAEIKDAARKVVESIEKKDPTGSADTNDYNDLILSTQTADSYEPEDHDDSLSSAGTDESYERNLYNGQDGTDLTYDITNATLEDEEPTEDEDSILHHDLSSTDAETERGDYDMERRDSSSRYGDVEDDVFTDGSDKSPRLSIGSAEEEPSKVNISNRNSWQSNRYLDLSEEAHQLVELNSPVVGEEAATESVISRIPSGTSHSRTSAPRARESSCSPRKVQRHPFRTPSDIRAMQMYSPAPSLFSTPYSVKRQQNPTVSRLGTPTGSQYSKSRTPTRFKKTREESSLVLLHVTVLPLQWQYAKAILAPELPANLYSIREAYYLLQEKLSETILTRGILLPHPQDSYECLQERFLDALELPVRPRAKILRCGHYMGPNTTSSDDDSDERDSGFGSTGRFRPRPDKVWCDICRRDVRYEDDDQNEDDKRFNVKIFASNGLMRAGAWAAAWREMERVDIEIEPFVQPWMVEDMEDLIERLREAEERDEDSYGHYSDDSSRESLGSEAQRLHEQGMDKVTLRQKRGGSEERIQRNEWLAAASKAAVEEAEKCAREAEVLRLREKELAKAKEEEARWVEEEAEILQLQKESEASKKAEKEAGKLHVEAESLRLQEEEAEVIRLVEEAKDRESADLDPGSPQHNDEGQVVKELEAEAQRIHEEEMALEEEEAQRIFEAELAEQRVLEEQAREIMEEEEVSRRAKEEERLREKISKQEKEAEETRLRDIYEKASTRSETTQFSSTYTPTSKLKTPTRTVEGDETLTELLVRAVGVAMRDRKNILILVLSVVVLILALKPTSTQEVEGRKSVPDIIIQNHRYEVGQSVDQRGYAASESALPMREIEGSIEWNGQGRDVVSTSSAPAVIQGEAMGVTNKGGRLEIDAPVPKEVKKPLQISASETENLQTAKEKNPVLEIGMKVEDTVLKDTPTFDPSSYASFEPANLPATDTEPQVQKSNIDSNTES